MIWVRAVVMIIVILFLLVEAIDIMLGVVDFMQEQQQPGGGSGGRLQKRSKQQPAQQEQKKNGPSSFSRTSSGGSKAKSSGVKKSEAKSRAFLYAIDDGDLPAVRRFLRLPDVDVNYLDDQGGALFRLCNKPHGDDPNTLQILELLLHDPDINVNGFDSSWPPLKLALSQHNVLQAKMLLEHPKIHQYVIATGLDCPVIDMAQKLKPKTNKKIVFVFAADDAECFKKAALRLPLSSYQYRFAKGELDGSSSPAAGRAGKPHRATTAAAGSATADGAGDFDENSIVLNPTRYQYFSEAAYTYVFGKSRRRTKGILYLWWAVQIPVQSSLFLIILLSCLTRNRNPGDEIPPPPPPAPPAAAGGAPN